MITGGYPSTSAGKSVELLFPNGTHMCEIKSLPDNGCEHSQSGTIICGGVYTVDSCLIYSGEGWQSYGKTLLHKRAGHSSWTQGMLK